MSINLRARYADTAVSTAAPKRLVTMCYDRILRDLYEARAAIDTKQVQAAHLALVHAQDIIAELDRALDLSIWPEGRELQRLYGYLRARLMEANLRKSRGPVEECVRIITPLAEAWHEAYRQSGVDVQ
jgi:flagellar protein FliS